MRGTGPRKRGDKRQEILAAASRTFLRAGLQGASIAAICAEAKISPGHLYHYFSSKEAIIEAFAELYLASLQEEFGAARENMSLESIFASEIRKTIKRSEVGVNAFFFEILAESTRNSRLCSIIQEGTKLHRSLIAALIRRAQDRGEIASSLEPEVVAPIIVGVMDSAKALRVRNKDLNVAKTVRSYSMMISSILSGDGLAESFRNEERSARPQKAS